MTESRTIRPQTADIVDMEHLLNGLSYSGHDFHAGRTGRKNSIIEELPQQESGTVRMTFGNERQFKNLLNEIKLELPTMYPSPAASYNPTKCPPNLAEAEKHGLAHQVCKINPYSTPDVVCESTGLPVNKKKLGIFCSPSRFAYLGPVFPMYFLFVKQVAALAFFLSCIAAYVVYGSDEYKDILDYQEMMTKIAQDPSQSLVFTIFIFAFITLSFVLLYVFRRNQKKTKMACKKTLVTPSDYSIMAYNMGRFHTEDEIKAFFSNYIVPGYALDVQKITVTYDIQKYVAKVRELKELMAKKEIADADSNYIMSGEAESINNKIEEIHRFFAQNKKLFIGCRGFKRNGLAFITFSSKQEAKFVKRKFEFSFLERCMIWLLEKCTDEFPEYFFKEHYIKVEKAPELGEIIWENLNCYNKKVGSTFLTLALSAVTIASVCFALVCLKEDLLEGLSYEIYIRCMIIAVANEILALINNCLIYNESFKTITEMSIAIERRTTVFQFINSFLPILLIDKYLAQNQASLSFNALVMVAMTCGVPLVLRILNFPFINRIFIRRSLVNKVQRNSNSCGITQEEANASHEYPEFDVLRVYADTTRTLLLTCLFFAVSPGVAVVAFVSFLVGHIVDKYNLLRRSLLPSSLRSEIAEAMFEFLDVGLFLLAIGVNFFIDLMDLVADDQNVCNTINIFATVLSTTYLLLPNKRFARSCFQRPKKVSWSDILVYLQAFEYFGEDYQGANIISRDDPDTSRFKDLYKTAYNNFKQIETISELPEILPIFDYANKRPSISDIKKNGLTGLRNPYYIFPQNYGYGSDSTRIPTSDLPTIKTPLMQQQNDSPFSAGKKEKQKVKLNEMVPSSYGSLSSSSKMGSAKGNSLLKDIMMIPSFHSKSDGEFHFQVASQKEEAEFASPNFGAKNKSESSNSSNNNIKNNVPEFQLDGSYSVTPKETVPVLEGISPISDPPMGSKGENKMDRMLEGLSPISYLPLKADHKMEDHLSL